MKSNNDFEEFDNTGPLDGEDFTDELEEGCPMTGLLMSMIMVDKPFGILWKSELMEKFLKKRGYKIITRYSDVTGSEYKVAFKAGKDEYIPETDVDNLRIVFSEEVQEILSEWLLGISKKDEK